MHHLLPPNIHQRGNAPAHIPASAMLDIGVTDHNGKCVAEALHYRGRRLLTHAESLERRTAEQSDWKHLKGRWFFGGIYFHHFGHFLTESVHRIHDYHKNFNQVQGILFIKSSYMGSLGYNPYDNEFTSVVLDQYFDLTRERVKFIDAPTIVDDLVCSPQLQQLSAPPDQEYIEVLDSYSQKFSNKIGQGNDIPEKAFLSRSGYLSFGRTLGMKAIEQVFSENDFEIIKPEEKSMCFQIMLFKKAKKLAVEAGSALHTLDILGKNDLELLIMSRRGHDGSYWVNAYQNRVSHISVFDAVTPLDAYLNKNAGKSPSVAHTGKLIEFMRRWGLNFDQQRLLIELRDAFHEDLATLNIEMSSQK